MTSEDSLDHPSLLSSPTDLEDRDAARVGGWALPRRDLVGGGGTGRDCLALPRRCSGAGDAARLVGWALLGPWLHLQHVSLYGHDA